jgi:hypothetical protein
MFDLDYEQLVKEKRVYFVTYGRGGILGVVDKAIDGFSNDLISIIKKTHRQEPQIITKLEKVYDSLIIELESESDFDTTKKVRIQKRIPLHQITFEKYGVVE